MTASEVRQRIADDIAEAAADLARDAEPRGIPGVLRSMAVEFEAALTALEEGRDPGTVYALWSGEGDLP